MSEEDPKAEKPLPFSAEGRPKATEGESPVAHVDAPRSLLAIPLDEPWPDFSERSPIMQVVNWPSDYGSHASDFNGRCIGKLRFDDSRRPTAVETPFMYFGSDRVEVDIELESDGVRIVFLAGRAVRLVWAASVHAIVVSDLLSVRPDLGSVIDSIRSKNDHRCFLREATLFARGVVDASGSMTPDWTDSVEVVSMSRLAGACVDMGYREALHGRPFIDAMCDYSFSFYPFHSLARFSLPKINDGIDRQRDGPFQMYQSMLRNPFLVTLVAHFPSWHPGESQQRMLPTIRMDRDSMAGVAEQVGKILSKSGRLAAEFALNDVMALAACRRDPLDISALVVRDDGGREIVWLDSVEAVAGLPMTGDDLHGLPADAFVRRAFHVGRRGRQKERPFWIYANRLQDFIRRVPGVDMSAASTAARFLEAVDARFSSFTASPGKRYWLTPTDSGLRTFFDLVVGSYTIRVIFDPVARELWLTADQAADVLEKSTWAFRRSVQKLLREGDLDESDASRQVFVKLGDGTFRPVVHYRFATVIAVAPFARARTLTKLLVSVMRMSDINALHGKTRHLSDFGR